MRLARRRHRCPWYQPRRFVEGAGPLENGILVSPLVSGATAELAASASGTNPTASSAAASTAGGGNAPAAAGGGGPVAAAIAGRVAFIAAIANQLPEAGAISLNTTSEEYVVTSLGSIDISFFLLAFCIWALLSCMFMICTAFFCSAHTPSPRSSVWPRGLT